MFIGHHAVAFGATGGGRLARQAGWKPAPLAVLMFAAMFLDLLWPLLCLAGIEHFRIDPGNTAFTPLDFYDYPISHSLATTLVWSLLAAIVWRRAIVGFAVLSHWILDFVTHRPDLPLWPGGPKAGLGLWHSVPATILVESGLLALGIYLFLRHRRGSFAFWSLVVFLAVIYIANILSPPPPSVAAVTYAALAAWLFVPWAWWIDRRS